MKLLGILSLLSMVLLMGSPQSSFAHGYKGKDKHKKKLTQIVNPPGLFDPSQFGFSHIVIGKSKRVAYISGQSGEDSTGNFDPDFETQVKRAHDHLKLALKAIKAKPNQVTKVNTYVVNYSPAQLEILAKYMKLTFGQNLPAQTLIPVPRLALDGMNFEIDATVMLDY